MVLIFKWYRFSSTFTRDSFLFILIQVRIWICALLRESAYFWEKKGFFYMPSNILIVLLLYACCSYRCVKFETIIVLTISRVNPLLRVLSNWPFCLCLSIVNILWQVVIDFGHLSFANTQALNRKKTVSGGQDSRAQMEGNRLVCVRLARGSYIRF